MRQPGIEPGSIAWKATMLTFTPPTLDDGVTIYISPEHISAKSNYKFTEK